MSLNSITVSLIQQDFQALFAFFQVYGLKTVLSQNLGQLLDHLICFPFLSGPELLFMFESSYFTILSSFLVIYNEGVILDPVTS